MKEWGGEHGGGGSRKDLKQPEHSGTDKNNADKQRPTANRFRDVCFALGGGEGVVT